MFQHFCSFLVYGIWFAFLFFSFSSSAFATAPSITAYPSETINLDTSFTVTATMSGLSKNVIYRLRTVVAPSGTSDYFGSTYNGTSWYNGTPSPINYANFLTITTDGAGSWGGDIQGKVDSDDPNFTAGSGIYDLKIGRYTQTGSTATWSNTVSITIVIPPTSTLTPTPASTVTPTPTKTPTPTLTPTKTPTPSPTKIPSATPSIKAIKKELTDEKLSSVSGEILGESISDQPTNPISTEETAKVLESKTNKTPLIFVILGIIIFIISCAILAFRIRKNGEKLSI